MRCNWTEEETILAFFYYCQIPFGKIDKSNPEIIRIANLIGRTPSAVALKMVNLASFDPYQQGRGIKGMQNASKLDKFTVEKFLSNWEELSFEARKYEQSLMKTIEKAPPDESRETTEKNPPGETREAVVKARINQDFFRNSVLASYDNRCCITGIPVPSLLIASHIKPWKDSDPFTERTNPSNGLCLNALHDKAFDKGLITVLPDLTVKVSTKLDFSDETMTYLVQCHNQKIVLPKKFTPKKEFLEYHNDMIFIP